jgi:hypothetical protein
MHRKYQTQVDVINLLMTEVNFVLTETVRLILEVGQPDSVCGGKVGSWVNQNNFFGGWYIYEYLALSFMRLIEGMDNSHANKFKEVTNVWIYDACKALS